MPSAPAWRASTSCANAFWPGCSARSSPGSIGGVDAWYISVFYPETVFDPGVSIFAIVFALFGGTATVVGPILGVAILYGIYNTIGITTPQYFQFIYGTLIMGLVMFLPNGMVSLFRRWGLNVP